MNERDFLQRQYASDRNLDTRIRTHQLYSDRQVDFAGWVLDHHVWDGSEQVLDVGCGNGGYVVEARQRCRHYIAADLSPGMLHSLPQPWPDRINLNALYLPFPTGQFDVLLANHMIYHLPDKARGIASLARVLRPDGTLLAATNGQHSMQELDHLRQAAANRLGLTGDPNWFRQLATTVSASSFTLENGAALLQLAFHRVERFDLRGQFIFPEPQPVIDYLGSSWERLQQLQPRLTWPAVEEALRQELDEHFSRHDTFVVNKLTGLFVCTKG